VAIYVEGAINIFR